MTVVFPCENCNGRGYLLVFQSGEFSVPNLCPVCRGEGCVAPTPDRDEPGDDEGKPVIYPLTAR